MFPCFYITRYEHYISRRLYEIRAESSITFGNRIVQLQFLTRKNNTLYPRKMSFIETPRLDEYCDTNLVGKAAAALEKTTLKFIPRGCYSTRRKIYEAGLITTFVYLSCFVAHNLVDVYATPWAVNSQKVQPVCNLKNSERVRCWLVVLCSPGITPDASTNEKQKCSRISV